MLKRVHRNTLFALIALILGITAEMKFCQKMSFENTEQMLLCLCLMIDKELVLAHKTVLYIVDHALHQLYVYIINISKPFSLHDLMITKTNIL